MLQRSRDAVVAIALILSGAPRVLGAATAPAPLHDILAKLDADLASPTGQTVALQPGNFAEVMFSDRIFDVTANGQKPEEGALAVKILTVAGSVARVRIYSEAGGMPITMETNVPLEKLTKLHPRNVDSAIANVRAAIAPFLSFEFGEIVRARDRDSGALFDGRFLGYAVRPDHILVGGAPGVVHEVPTRTVYKGGTGYATSETPSHPVDARSDRSWALFAPRPVGPVAQFLEGAAWITSHPDFRSAKPLDQAAILMRFGNAVFPRKDMLGMYTEALGMQFEEMALYGIGVCRHMASLMYAFYREAGFPARILRATDRAGKDAHAWVWLGGGKNGTVADLMLNAVLTVDTVRTIAAGHAVPGVSPEFNRVLAEYALDFYVRPSDSYPR